MERGGAGPNHEDVGLVGVARVADLARDHPQARVAPQEPAADAVDATEGLGAVADVNPHLGVLGHEPDRRLAVPRVQQLEERLHRVHGTHGPSVPVMIGGCRPSSPESSRSTPRSHS